MIPAAIARARREGSDGPSLRCWGRAKAATRRGHDGTPVTARGRAPCGTHDALFIFGADDDGQDINWVKHNSIRNEGPKQSDGAK